MSENGDFQQATKYVAHIEYLISKQFLFQIEPKLDIYWMQLALLRFRGFWAGLPETGHFCVFKKLALNH